MQHNEQFADWSSTGRKLIQEIKTLSEKRGATQILVVCGVHDESKRHFLKGMGLTVASEWYVGEMV
ncbi:MAG: hypothetical protein HYX61_12885 [Gammaproteobacteria bacterium]|nr:hypothetical protein [Gammaproteobacteria bacterium]